jgi:electron transfer flavoprotein alpha/beta subunit
VLAGELKKGAFDLIIAGHRAVDDDNFQVGPAVAELMGIPHISMVIRQELTEGKIRCTRTIDGGTLVLETALPALITTQRGLNEPRYASLPGIMKAKKKPIDTRTCRKPAPKPERPWLGPLPCGSRHSEKGVGSLRETVRSTRQRLWSRPCGKRPR